MISFQTAKMSSGVNVFDEHPGNKTYNVQNVEMPSIWKPIHLKTYPFENQN